MKKTMLGVLGLAGACAVCCAAPVGLTLGLPVLSALAASVVTGWGAAAAGWGIEWLVAVAVAAGASTVAVAVFLRRRFSAPTCQVRFTHPAPDSAGRSPLR